VETVLVTGANGALGQSLVNLLQCSGLYQVILTSRLSNNKKFHQVDVRNFEEIKSVIDSVRPDIIFHLVATFVNDFNEAYSINVESSKNILDAVKQSGRSIRVCLVGSAAEYGVVNPEENPIHESRLLKPISIYGLTKAWQTQLGGFYFRQGLRVVIARIFNLDGANLSDRLFIGRLQKQISEVLSGEKTVIELGPLDATRDYIVTDEASKQLLNIGLNGVPGQIYHVASGIPVTMREMLLRYLKYYNLDVSIVRESIDLTNHTGYDVPEIYADITKTIQLISA